MFQLIGKPKGIERVTVQIIVTPQWFEKYRVRYKARERFLLYTILIQDMTAKTFESHDCFSFCVDPRDTNGSF